MKRFASLTWYGRTALCLMVFVHHVAQQAVHERMQTLESVRLSDMDGRIERASTALVSQACPPPPARPFGSPTVSTRSTQAPLHYSAGISLPACTVCSCSAAVASAAAAAAQQRL